MGNELILIANALNQIANELAEIKYILKYSNNESHHEKMETEHGPNTTGTHCLSRSPQAVIDKTYTYEEFRRNAQ